jgi:hypothetical protein
MRYLKTIFGMLAVVIGLSGCGKPFEVEELPEEQLAELTMGRHTIDLMVGDTFQVPTKVTPDSLAGRGIYWESADTTIVRISEGKVVALAPGETSVKAIAMAGEKSDTCHVRVLPLWVIDPYVFRYDMVVYADVKVNNQNAHDNMVVGVFGQDEDGLSQLKGLGNLRRSADGLTYMQLRIYSNNDNGEPLSVKCYDRSQALLMESNDRLTFENNSTLGTLSSLYSIAFEEKK